MPKTTYKGLRTSLIKRREKHEKWKDIGFDFPGVPLGTLCRIVKDESYEPKSHVLRAHLGLEPLPVSVEPLPCGHAPLKKRCPICCPGAPTKYAAHPVMRLSKIRRILQSPYKDS